MEKQVDYLFIVLGKKQVDYVPLDKGIVTGGHR